MQHLHTLDGLALPDSWVTVGTFDGVHAGHRQIIQNITDGAHRHGLPAVVVTFFPHPALVLRKRDDPFYLTTPDERAALLGALGVDLVVTHPFTPEVAAVSAADFMARLKTHTGLTRLGVGYDFALGRGREGAPERLRQIGLELGYTVEVGGPVQVNGEVVSSSAIRAALAAGDIPRVTRMLGRPFRLGGEVVRGDGRGRTLGFATANLKVWAARAIPASGVYACRVQVDGRDWPAVTNIGVRPTFEDQPVPARIETHILDFDGDLYDQSISVEFIARLRDEQRFPNIAALAAQINTDIAAARQLLNA